MQVAMTGMRHCDGGQSQLLASDTEAGHQVHCGVDRSSDERDRTGKYTAKYNALASEAMVLAGSTSLYNTRSTDALVKERLRACKSRKHSLEQHH